MGFKRRRRTHYDRPHDIYVLADPRTGEIRYVGRTVQGVAHRFERHLSESKRGVQPVQRWIRRLATRGLRPLVICVAEGGHHWYETDLCEALVNQGVRLLNVTPSAPRTEGRVIVDVEQEGRGYVGDVVHLGLSVSAKGHPFNIRETAIAAAFRRMADILDPPHGSTRPSQYELETARLFALRYVDLVVAGKTTLGLGAHDHAANRRAVQESGADTYAKEAKAAIRKAQTTAKKAARARDRVTQKKTAYRT